MNADCSETRESERGNSPESGDRTRPLQIVYLHPGELYASKHPSAVMTILGSCVSVCLWDSQRQIGGMNHFLLPWSPGTSSRSARYGDVAMEDLIERLVSLGARPDRLRARVFGGACVLEAFRGDDSHLGARNVDLAIKQLSSRGIRVAGKMVGGRVGYKVRFLTHSGTAVVRTLKSDLHVG